MTVFDHLNVRLSPQIQESTEFAPIRIFWKDGHNDFAGGTVCVPWMVEPVTEATLERLLADWDCVFADYRRANKRKEAREDEPESNKSQLLDDGQIDIKERHDKDAEARGPYPVQRIPAWFDQPSDMQTVKFECNGRKRILHQRKFSRLHDIASKVSHLGTRIYYDDPDVNELLFGEFVSCILYFLTHLAVLKATLCLGHTKTHDPTSYTSACVHWCPSRVLKVRASAIHSTSSSNHSGL